MAKLTRADVAKMRRKDKEHLIFDGKNALTKRLPIQQIEAIFPDSLLILTDIAYDTDSEGNLRVVAAIVDRFCETAQEASDYINDCCNSDLETGTPYHTGVTKFNHDRYLTHVGNPSIAMSEQEQYAEQELEFPFSPISTDKCNVKDIDYMPLYNFFCDLEMPAEVDSP